MDENIFFERYCQLCEKLTSIEGQEGINSP